MVTPAPRYVVVTGLPASGKSTLARAVATAFDLPLFDKDALLEAPFETEGTGDAAWRRSLSRRADVAFEQQATAAGRGVLSTWWRHPCSPVDSGTPTDWLAILPGTVVELHCACSSATAAARFMARHRHPGHLDGRWTNAELLSSFSRQAALGPVLVGRRVEVSTESPPDMHKLTNCIEQAFESTSHGAHLLSRRRPSASGTGPFPSPPNADFP